ncbi:MAG: DNA gyrase subunit A, partial [Nanoarchaeota archaeon]|nr:DNA gyrase subunit A [Nanoarchaeota archaeon]
MEENKQKTQGKVINRVIEDEMKQSYLDYSMSVIIGRALPDVRDGLKPVHRRILFAMHNLAMFHNKPFKKSARIVGEVLGKYHPHGDIAVYDSLVRMVQPFSLRYPLINGQGNFGSVDGDSAAAMRYSEARLNKLSEEMLKDIEKQTVKFTPNFDNSLKEPSVLPSKFPNLLVNGSSGIAVGMATNIPPHNITEICNGVIEVINNKDIEIENLFKIIQGPDFPTAGIICGRKSILDTYKQGRGKIIVRGKAEIEENKGKQSIIIKEIPYMVNKAGMVEATADLVRDKKIRGITGIRDESDREGMRVVIELSRDANPDVVLNLLYKHTRLQVTFGVIMLALVNNVPKILNLKELITEFI